MPFPTEKQGGLEVFLDGCFKGTLQKSQQDNPYSVMKLSTTQIELLDTVKHKHDFRKVMNSFNTENYSLEELENVMLERKVLNMGYKGGCLVYSQFVDFNAQHVSKYKMPESERQYFEARLNETKSTFLGALYAQILWQETKHQKFATEAVERYSSLINGQSTQYEVDQWFSAMLYIDKVAFRGKYLTDQQRLNLLFSCARVKNASFEVWVSQHLGTEEQNKQILDSFEQLLANDYFSDKVLFEFGQILANRLNYGRAKMNYLNALSLDSVLEQHQELHDWLGLAVLQEKIYYLKKADSPELPQAAEEELTERKKHVSFGQVSSTTDEATGRLWYEFAFNASERILNQFGSDVWMYFSAANDILPRRDDVKSFTENTKSNVNAIGIKLMRFDSNMNASNNPNAPFLFDENAHMNLALNVQFISVFSQVLEKLYIRNINGLQSLIDYFKKTWLASVPANYMGGQPIGGVGTCLDLMLPGIYSFVHQHEAGLLNRFQYENCFQLSIDSLVQRFEGTFRTFIRMQGGNTTTMKSDGTAEEKPLEALLNHEIAKHHFSENELYLFNFVFTKQGLNLRNEIAHGFSTRKTYHFGTMAMVLLCFIRLSGFSVHEKK